MRVDPPRKSDCDKDNKHDEKYTQRVRPLTLWKMVKKCDSLKNTIKTLLHVHFESYKILLEVKLLAKFDLRTQNVVWKLKATWWSSEGEGGVINVRSVDY